MAEVTVGELQDFLKKQNKDITAENIGWAFENYDPAPFSNEKQMTNTGSIGSGTNLPPEKPNTTVDPFADETIGKTEAEINQRISNQKTSGFSGEFSSTPDPAKGLTLKAYDENNNIIYVKPKEYVKGASLTPKQLNNTGASDTTMGGTGTGTNTTQQSEEDKLFDAYIKSLQPSNAEIETQQKLNDEQTRLENAKIGIMSDPAEMRFLTGQEANVEKRSLAKQNTLQRQLALEQAKREMSSTVSKAQYDRAEKKAEAKTKATQDLNKHYSDLALKGYSLVTDQNAIKDMKSENLFVDPYSGKTFIKPTIAGNEDIYTFKETDEKTGKNYVVGINKKTGQQIYKTDIGILSKVSTTGSGTKKQDFTLSSDAKSSLLGAGLSLTDIKAIQDNINNGYSVDEIISSSGIDEEKSKAVRSVFGKQEKAGEYDNLTDDQIQLLMTKYVDDNGEYDPTKAPASLILEIDKRGLSQKEEEKSGWKWPWEK